MLFQFDQAQFVYDPYPIGVVRPAFSEANYRRMVSEWPRLEDFQYMPSLGDKYSLSEVNRPDVYHRYIQNSTLSRAIHDEIKSEAFIRGIVETLAAHHIDLGVRDKFRVISNGADGLKTRLGDAVQVFRGNKLERLRLRSRFEFSMLPADGGNIRPHTDSPSKIITLVVAILGENEWNPAFGGGTDMLRPKDARQNFNYMNRFLEFDQTEVISTFPFEPNQCVVFVKTFNSLHAVRPMQGQGSKLMRKTLTINIESV